jgi:hypothetical protein
MAFPDKRFLFLLRERPTARIWMKCSYRAFLALCLLLVSCRFPDRATEPSIEFTRLPPVGEGSPLAIHTIEGRVRGARPDQRIVLFARSGVWWVQPLEEEPFTSLRLDSTFKNTTHPGSAYAALLVNPGYTPPLTLDELPPKGKAIAAIAVADGMMLERAKVKTLRFSGYEWSIRETPSDAGGTANLYDPQNVWTDAYGFLHLRIARQGDHWTSAEASLTLSLGYGSYRFVVRDVSKMEPAAVFTISTWDDQGPPREMDIEIGRWGEADSKNAQYVLQPYYVPANVVRFTTPPGTLTYSFRWEPGRVQFNTTRESTPSTIARKMREHVFTSGVPTPGNETIRLNHYVFDNKKNPLQHGSEVIIERFEYLP